MRAIRVVLATALTLSAAAVVAAAPTAADPSPPYTAVTGTGDPVYGGGAAFAYDGPAVTVSSPTTAGLTFDVAASGGQAGLHAAIAPPTGATLANGTHYSTGRFASGTD